MQEETNLGNVINTLDSTKLEYDQSVKKVLADIQILSRILKYTVSELECFEVDEIMKCIDESTIKVGEIRIDPGYTNMDLKSVESVRTEDSVPNEGYITYDIRFYIYVFGEMRRVIINVEAQKSSNPSQLGYHIENRIQFYVARMISAQKTDEFANSNYDDIKKVYSIWICMNAGKEEDSITRIGLNAINIYGKPPYLPELDKMNAVIIRIRSDKNVEESKHSLIAMLEDLIRSEDKEIKKQNLSNKYNFKFTRELERGVEEMCNASAVLEEQITTEVTEKKTTEAIIKTITILRKYNVEDEKILLDLRREYGLSEEEAKSYL